MELIVGTIYLAVLITPEALIGIVALIFFFLIVFTVAMVM